MTVPPLTRYAAILDGEVWGVGSTAGEALDAYRAELDRLEVPDVDREGAAPFTIAVVVDCPEGREEEALAALVLLRGAGDEA